MMATALQIADIQLPAQYAALDEAAYRRASDAWRATPSNERGDPPLNPEQRAVAATFYRVMKYRALASARGDTAKQIRDAIDAARYPAVILLIGAGGTG